MKGKCRVVMVVWDGPSPITFSDVCVQGWHVIVLVLGLKQNAFVTVSECIKPSCLDFKPEERAITDKSTSWSHFLSHFLCTLFFVFIFKKNNDNTYIRRRFISWRFFTNMALISRRFPFFFATNKVAHGDTVIQTLQAFRTNLLSLSCLSLQYFPNSSV